MSTIPLLVVGHDPRDPNAFLPFEDRLGHCYELAGKYLTAEAHAGREGALVHGTIQGVNFGFPDAPVLEHAWVETADGGVFEPTSGRWWPYVSLFMDLHNAVVRVRYTAEEAASNMLLRSHYGPWDYCKSCLDDECDGCAVVGCGCVHR